LYQYPALSIGNVEQAKVELFLLSNGKMAQDEPQPQVPFHCG